MIGNIHISEDLFGVVRDDNGNIITKCNKCDRKNSCSYIEKVICSTALDFIKPK
jgi:hypothetical protein